jgi:hypothetical protein
MCEKVILKEYGQLLEDYKALRKAYDGKHFSNGVDLAVEEARNPYVMVLIDGNGYIVRVPTYFRISALMFSSSMTNWLKTRRKVA